MGVEYSHFLIPRESGFRPDPAQLAQLVDGFATGNWIAVPGSAALKEMAHLDETSPDELDERWAHNWRRNGESETLPYPLSVDWLQPRTLGDLQLRFYVRHADQVGLRHPLGFEQIPEDPYYEIRLHLAEEYVHRMSECIEPANTTCSCGNELNHWLEGEEDLFYAERIRPQCPQCKKAFDASRIPVTVRDGWTGETSKVLGGAIYRFAIVVDCGKCIPRTKTRALKADRDFTRMCEKAIGCKLYQVGDMY